MTPRSRRRDRRAIWAACALIQIVPLSAWLATTAKADVITDYAADVAPVVCGTLDGQPTFAGIELVGKAVVDVTGFTYEQAGLVIKTAIVTDCARHVGLWNRFVVPNAPRVVAS